VENGITKIFPKIVIKLALVIYAQPLRYMEDPKKKILCGFLHRYPPLTKKKALCIPVVLSSYKKNH
jgi:hypothetical protein